MRVDDMISRATFTSGRSCLAISALVIASSVFKFELDKLPLIEKGDLSPETLQIIAIPIIMFMAIGHALNWLNDRRGYLSLHAIEAGSPGYRLKYGEHLDKRNSLIIQIQETLPEKETQRLNAGQLIELRSTLSQLYSFNEPFDILWHLTNWTEKFSLYVQHFIVPVGAAAWAIASIMCGS